MIHAKLAIPLFAVAIFGTAFADEGRVPLYQQTTITQPGYYIFTRDISTTSGDGITIQSNDVIVDLNGHSLTQSTGSGYGVNILDGYTNTTIRNGQIHGFSVGIWSSQTTQNDVILQNLRVDATGNFTMKIINARQVEIGHSTIMTGANTGIWVTNTVSLPVVVNIHDNTVIGTAVGILVDGPYGGAIKNNLITESGANVGIDIGGSSVSPIGGVSIEGNHVVNAFFGIDIGVDGCRLVSNVVKGSSQYGIVVPGNDALVYQNDSSKNGSYGIYVTGARNLLDSNVGNANGSSGTVYGIYILGTYNVYRNNITRGNAGNGGILVPGGNTNTNGGGNN
jgi:hypothetical protein